MTACVDTLTACKDQATTGSDLQDCHGSSVAQCFKDADVCMAYAAKDCGDSVQTGGCGAPVVWIGLLFVGLGFVRMKKDRK